MSSTVIITPILVVLGLHLLAGAILLIYFLIYKRNANNALREKKHTSLPDIRTVAVILGFIVCFAVLIVQSVRISKLKTDLESGMNGIADNLANIYEIIDGTERKLPEE